MTVDQLAEVLQANMDYIGTGEVDLPERLADAILAEFILLPRGEYVLPSLNEAEGRRIARSRNEADMVRIMGPARNTPTRFDANGLDRDSRYAYPQEEGDSPRYAYLQETGGEG